MRSCPTEEGSPRITSGDEIYIKPIMGNKRERERESASMLE